MKDVVIKVENLGKIYQIGKKQNPASIRERINDLLSNPFRSDSNRSEASQDDPQSIWALKNVTFSVRQGEIVGIIGRNGAGKSTLLKILSSITDPTEGEAEIEGRVATLLEVGTGFHPELTGRENIMLNAAILGMKRFEIKEKFAEIVGFSEIEKFIDTPVKHYSSGMYVRLAFAVAAYLQSEILLVDEVLAVGDAAFQKKCLGKMNEVTQDGRTILFVSHNMGALMRVCSRCIWLEEGTITADGPVRSVIQSYIGGAAGNIAVRTWKTDDSPGDSDIALRATRVCQPYDVPNSSVDITEDFYLEMEIDVSKRMEELTISIQILNVHGEIVLHTANVMDGGESDRNSGVWLFICQIPKYTLNIGTYSLSIGADIPYRKQIFSLENLLTWNVEPLSEEMGRYDPSSWKGVIGPGIARWSVRQQSPGKEQSIL